MRRTLILLLSLAVGCQFPGKSAQMSSGDESSSTLSNALVGKRIRVQLRTGGVAITGTLRSVQPERDSAVIELDHGTETGKLTLRLSQVLWVEELTPQAAKEKPQEKEDPDRFTSERLDPKGVRVVYVNFRHNHPHEECLLDMAKPIRENPNSLLFVDEASTATLSVRIPDEAKESLLPWQWHAHIVGENGSDRLERMNNDGQVVLDLKGISLPATLLLVGTPIRLKNDETKVNVLAPPRVVGLHILKADVVDAVLRTNSEMITGLRSGMGTLYAAATPINENEMVLSLYDPSLKHAGFLNQAKFSVQDALLIPSLVLEVTNQEGALWQRIGCYPVPPILSHDTPDTRKIHVEIAGKRIDDGFIAPAQVSVRVPDRAAVKADVDVRLYGLSPQLRYTFIAAHGRPDLAGKEMKFQPVVKELDATTSYHAVGVDLSDVRADTFPAQIFLWHHMAVRWNLTGGFLPPARISGGSTSTPPSRRLIFYPANAPHLKFIYFSGPRLDLSGGGGGAGALTTGGFIPNGGLTLGRGGPESPFSYEVGSMMVNTAQLASSSGNNGTQAADLGSRPIGFATAHSAPFIMNAPVFTNHNDFNPMIELSASSRVSASAIAICGGGGCGGGKETTLKDVPTGEPGPGFNYPIPQKGGNGVPSAWIQPSYVPSISEGW